MIYFIKGKDKVKIGYSKDPRQRLKQLQASSPTKLKIIGLMEGDYQTECALHRIFDKNRSHAEWFNHVGLLKDCITATNMNLRSIRSIKDFLKAGTELQIRKKAKRKSKRGNGKLKHKINVLTKPNKKSRAERRSSVLNELSVWGDNLS